jgi:hypothetical protein
MLVMGILVAVVAIGAVGALVGVLHRILTEDTEKED